MRKTKKWIALGLSLAMVAGLVACGNTDSTNNSAESSTPAASSEKPSEESSATPEPEVKDPVTLEWWYRGNGIQQDTEKVEEEFNKLLQTFPGMEHVTVNLQCYTGAEYGQAVALAQAAEEQMDLLSSVYLNFADEASKGSWMALDGYLEQYPNLKNELPEWLWKLGSYEGVTYIVPNYQRACNPVAAYIPKEYMDKYGDLEKMTQVLGSDATPYADKVAVLEEFVEAVRKGEGETRYAGSISAINYLRLMDYNDVLTGDFVVFEDSTEVEYSYMSEDAVKSYEVAADWYQKGYIPKDMLSRDEATLFQANMMNPEGHVWTLDNMLGDAQLAGETMSKTYGFDVYALPIHDHYYARNSWAAGGTGVAASCENPEEAVRLLELMTTEEGTELYNMVVYGLEDVHYTKNADGTIKTLHYDGTQGGVDAPYAAMKWIMGNTFHAYQNQGCTPGENEISLEMNESPDTVGSKLSGFIADTKDIQTELEQINAVRTEYANTLGYGVTGADWEKTYNEFVTKLEAAGLQTVLDNLQAQVDAFLAK